MVKTVRVFMPYGNQYYLESAWVEINGERSKQPTAGQPQYRDKAYIDAEVQKGNAVIDASMAIIPGMAQRQAKGNMAPSTNGIVSNVQQNKITLSLTPGAVVDGTLRIGWNTLIGYFNSTIVKNAELTIGGTFTTDTLNYFTKLVDLGLVKIKEIEINGSADAVFEATQPVFKRYNAFGELMEEKRINYPVGKSGDNDTTIRLMDEKYLHDVGADLTLDGYSYLELFITKSLTASLVLTLEITPRA